MGLGEDFGDLVGDQQEFGGGFENVELGTFPSLFRVFAFNDKAHS
jgi:hypothetical protein